MLLEKRCLLQPDLLPLTNQGVPLMLCISLIGHAVKLGYGKNPDETGLIEGVRYKSRFFVSFGALAPGIMFLNVLRLSDKTLIIKIFSVYSRCVLLAFRCL